MIPALPGTPGPRLQAVWDELSPAERDALLPHLAGSTSADWIAKELTRAGHSIGSTSIKDYKRALRAEGGRV